MMDASQVRDKIAELVDNAAANALGNRYSSLAPLDWADDPQNEEGMFPWLIEDADGNRFEVEIEVTAYRVKS